MSSPRGSRRRAARAWLGVQLSAQSPGEFFTRHGAGSSSVLPLREPRRTDCSGVASTPSVWTTVRSAPLTPASSVHRATSRRITITASTAATIHATAAEPPRGAGSCGTGVGSPQDTDRGPCASRKNSRLRSRSPTNPLGAIRQLDVIVDGRTIYSKQASHRMPAPGEVSRLIQQQIAG